MSFGIHTQLTFVQFFSNLPCCHSFNAVSFVWLIWTCNNHKAPPLLAACLNKCAYSTYYIRIVDSLIVILITSNIKNINWKTKSTEEWKKCSKHEWKKLHETDSMTAMLSISSFVSRMLKQVSIFFKNHIYSIVFNFFPSFPAKASLCVGKMIQILIFTLCKHFDHQQHNTINGILPLHKENVEYKIN